MKVSASIALAAAAAAVLAAATLLPRAHAESQIDRGKYLVTLGGCNDCHTPGYFFGKPDMARYLGGSEVAFEIPGVGAFPGRNITPDKETGIGNWTTEQIVTALQQGKRPDGRMLAPIMPYHAFSYLTKEDAFAIAAFLQSIPPVKNEVAGLFKPGDQITIFTFRILPPGDTAAAAPK
ncbi:MAG TPA: cytochrome c [Xanthobacteraceae bacterium]|nr:cytochrome c [Xanthobacteraceae bacterium]